MSDSHSDLVCPFTFKFILMFFCLYLSVQAQEEAERNSVRGSCIAWDTAVCANISIYSCLSHLLALECFKIVWMFKLVWCICLLQHNKTRKRNQFWTCVLSEMWLSLCLLYTDVVVLHTFLCLNGLRSVEWLNWQGLKARANHKPL